MKHKWGEGESAWGDIVSECAVCGGFRIRERVAGLDYANGNGIHIDMVGATRKGWSYGDTPRSCPGHKVDATESEVSK